MLRALIVVLLLLNALFFGWSRGWLDGALGLRAGGEHEPERFKLEARPERMTLLSPQAVSALQTRACVELGPLAGDEALQTAQAALARLGLTPADWQVQSSEQAGVWAVATIKLGSADFRARNEETYKKLKIAFEPLPGLPDEQPSLLLSRHTSAAAAETALAGYEQRALRGLRVLQLQAPLNVHSLQLPRADGSLQAQLRSGKEAAALGTAGIKPCTAAAPAGAASSSNGSSAPASATR
jgi:hypothetical protein